MSSAPFSMPDDPPDEMWRGTYDARFFRAQGQGARRSAAVVVPLLLDLLSPSSAVDVGCGSGAWLAAMHDLGVPEILGIDGFSSEGDRDIPPSRFLSWDLTTPIDVPRRFDLALCLDVGQDLPPAHAPTLVRSLTEIAPLVLFSSGLPFQPGTLGRNLQWPSYWAALFQENGFLATDPLRKALWHDERVDYWYAQTALLYVSREYAAGHPDTIQRLGGPEARPLDLVHPKLYLHANAIGGRRALGIISGSVRRRLARASRRRASG